MPQRPTSVSIGIMAVESRREHFARLAARIGGSVHVYVDDPPRGCWHGWRSTWELCARSELDATHIAILADDIAVCADFRATLDALVAARPESIVAGWLPRDQVSIAHAAGLRWASTRSLHFVQCLAMPRELGDRAISWIAAREAQLGDLWHTWDDERLRAFALAHGLDSYVPVPNICDHLGGDGTIASTFGHYFAPESARARAWLGEHGLGAGLDWSDLRAIGDQDVHPYRAPRILLTPYNRRTEEPPP